MLPPDAELGMASNTVSSTIEIGDDLERAGRIEAAIGRILQLYQDSAQDLDQGRKVGISGNLPEVLAPAPTREL